MQPTTPFNTHSWALRISDIAGGVAFVSFFYWQRWTGLSVLTQSMLVLAWMSYAFIRFCGMIRWHKGAQRGEGIEQQFIQVAAAAVYGFFLATLAAVTHVAVFLIYPIAIILAVVVSINITLLYLSHKDTSAVPINFYSHRKFLQEDA